MKLVCVMHSVYNDIVLFEVIDSKNRSRFTVKYHSNVPILIHQYSTATRFVSHKWRLASDKASLLQLRRMKQLTNQDFYSMTQIHPDDMASKVFELMGEAIAQHMDDLLTGSMK